MLLFDVTEMPKDSVLEQIDKPSIIGKSQHEEPDESSERTTDDTLIEVSPSSFCSSSERDPEQQQFQDTSQSTHCAVSSLTLRQHYYLWDSLYTLKLVYTWLGILIYTVLSFGVQSPSRLMVWLLDAWNKLFPRRTISIGNRKVTEVRLLSEGGYSYVDLVQDLSTGELFALKRVVCQTTESLQNIKREIDIWECLPPHPNIVEYYGHCIEEGTTAGSPYGVVATAYLLFELCDDYLQDQKIGFFTEDEILKTITDVAMALLHLHSQKPFLYHRDIKLENILYSRRSKLYKLCDFGSMSCEVYHTECMKREEILRLEDTISRTITLMYRPPEVADLYQKQTINDKADIWMLGCVTYCLMFGQHPFQDASVLAISAAQFDVPSNFYTYSDKLLDLMFWMLAKKPDLRPTANELLQSLKFYKTLNRIPLPEDVAKHRNRVLCDVAATDMMFKMEH